MKHVQGVKTLPCPIFAASAAALFGQSSASRVGSRGKQFVIVFVSRGQPLRGPVGKNLLQKRGAPPLIKIRILSKKRLDKSIDRSLPRPFEKRHLRGGGLGDPLPVLQAFDDLLTARVLTLQ